MSTSERNIRAVLEDSGPDFDAFSYERPTAGHQGEVFLVTLEYAGETYEVVVKFDSGEGEFGIEPFLHDYVADRTELPVPRILVFEERPNTELQPYFVTERIEGRNLAQALGELDRETRRCVIEHVGQILGDMHAEVGFEGFGHLGLDDGRLIVRDVSWDWQQFFRTLVEQYIDLLETTPFDGLQSQARAYLQDNIDVIESTGVPRLVHDDFRPANMLFEPTAEEPITAVLDWQFVLAGDPEYHLARTDFLFIDPAFRDGKTRDRLRQHLYAGYREHVEFEPTDGYRERRQVYHFATLVWRMASFDAAFADFPKLARARAEARFRKQFEQLVSEHVEE